MKSVWIGGVILIRAGLGLLAGTIIQDFLTAGGGTADDPFTIPPALLMIQ